MKIIKSLLSASKFFYEKISFIFLILFSIAAGLWEPRTISLYDCNDILSVLCLSSEVAS